MRKLVGVSQRVTVMTEYQERRDTIDQRWAAFLTQCGLIPIYLPNHLPTIAQMLESLPLEGFVLTGGNSLVAYGGDAPERDAAEHAILDYAIAQQRPTLGVCRGMQVVQDYFDVALERIEGHVTPAHRISGRWGTRDVNSYHQFAARTTHADLEITARSEDGLIEAISHRTLPIQGIMWHPERCSPFDRLDCELVANLFGLHGLVHTISEEVVR